MRFACTAIALILLSILGTTTGRAAATLGQQVDPLEVNVGDPVTVTLTVQGGNIKRKEASTIFGMVMPAEEITLPDVDGLQSVSYRAQNTIFNGSSATSVSVTLIPVRPGDFTIPAFDIAMEDGTTLHTKPMKIHVAGSTTPNSFSSPNPAPNPTSLPAITVPSNPNGPVIMPPANEAPPTGDAAESTNSDVSVPRDKDGGPAKVFLIITPQTTDAYVGQSIPLRIDFYIRQDVYAEQNSLPTIQGSDFLMNNFTTGGHGSEGILENEQYVRESWNTAISAPKSGDFPLCMVRDTYWIKSIASSNLDPFFGGIFNRHANLAHELITSNLLTIHVHPLPTEGRPAHFTGAIGNFQVTGDARPNSVAVGDPVTLYFSVAGEGNFDYVRCPFVPDDPAWKSYVAKSKTNYRNESHTNAVKTFEQSVIPQKNGNVPLSAASFSYFDSTAKQYVTVPIPLPAITVTGAAAPLPALQPAAGPNSTTLAAAPKTTGFLPNRLELGSPRLSLVPPYRRPWFWLVQGLLAGLTLLAVIFLVYRARSIPDEQTAQRERSLRSLHEAEEAMAEAARRNQAAPFFVAARCVIQLHLGAQWKIRPEAVTPDEISGRDPELSEQLKPIFDQADEIIYSGRATPHLNLTEWEQLLRTALHEPQVIRS